MQGRYRSAGTQAGPRWSGRAALVGALGRGPGRCSALLVSAVMAWQTRHLPGAGTPAPDFTLRTLSGEQVRLADLRGKPVVLAFWAPWCGVCKAESSTLSALRGIVGELGPRGVRGGGLRGRGGRAPLRARARGGLPGAARGRGDAAGLPGGEFPTTFFLSSEGRIEQSAVGYTTRLGLVWRLLL